MKGMLTGPITILQWSFVRDDQPRRDTAFQIALAIRDEVADLEAAGIRVIQIDEPALREGLPLRRRGSGPAISAGPSTPSAWRSAGVRDETQIHTHMCYSEFNDIIESIAALDADVISIEASRSDMELLDAFVRFKYPNEIGPGVYDIHSPRVPEAEEIMGRLQKGVARDLRPDQLWVNPDCGLKTRGWPEVQAALRQHGRGGKTIATEVNSVRDKVRGGIPCPTFRSVRTPPPAPCRWSEWLTTTASTARPAPIGPVADRANDWPLPPRRGRRWRQDVEHEAGWPVVVNHRSAGTGPAVAST